MSDIETSEKTGWIRLLKGTGKGDLPTPFEREIELFDTTVAGTSHIENIEECTKELTQEDILTFTREPNNPYDPHAIMIRTEKGEKIGYVPKKDNVVFSRLMDAGKLLYGRITKKECQGNWVKIDLKIYLKD